MKILKFLVVFVLIIGLVVAARVYYPQYQILQMKHQTAAARANNSKISYLNYFRNSKKTVVYHLAIGDSVIHGVGAPQDENLVDQFSNRLEDQIHKKIQFQNDGMNGITSGELKNVVLKGTFDNEIKKADIITINVGGNDILRLVKDGNVYNALKNFDGIKSAFSKNLMDIRTHIRTINPQATLVFLELYNPLPTSEKVFALADQLLPNWNLQIYQVSAHDPSSIVVETTKVINGEKPTNLSPDGVHPNSAGYTAISEQMIFQFKHQYRKKTV
jgi:lysophospholipase L1-like esterase